MTTWTGCSRLWLTLLFISATVLAQGQPRPPAAKPLTDAECEAFGRQLEEGFEDGNPRFYIQAFDTDALLDKVLSAQDIGDDMQNEMAEFKKGFKSGFRNGFVGQLRQIESLKFLRVKRVGGEVRVLCRVLPATGGMNYQELVVERGTAGALRFTDMFIFLTGEMMSETIRRATIPLLAEKKKSVLERLFNQRPDMVKYFAEWSELSKLSSAGKYKEALAAYAKLPPSLQKEKFILLHRVKAASALDNDPEYLAALELWQRTYPRDPSLDLVSIDVFVLRKQYAKALASVDRLNKAVGGDPYLDYQRGLMFQLMSDIPKSDEALNRAIEQEPTLAAAHFQLLTHRVEERKFSEATRVLSKVQADMGIPQQKLAAIIEEEESYAPLAGSQEYQNWKGVPAAAPNRPVPVVKVPAPGGLKLQSIVYREVGASATINGKYLTIGERIAGHTLLAVEKESVTLETPAGEKKVLRMGEVLK